MPRKPASDRAKAVGKGLKAMFRALEQRPVPDRLRAIADEFVEDDGSGKPRGKG